jgi:hypothetical protein
MHIGGEVLCDYWIFRGTTKHCVSPLLASVFSLFGQRKVTKRKATPTTQPAKKTAGSLVGHDRRGR